MIPSEIDGKPVTSIGNSAFYNCTRLKTVYYSGTEEQWNKISIGSYNDPLLNAEIIYNYVVEEPVETPDYLINSITIKNSLGEILTEIPDEKFLATVSFTTNVSNSNTMVVLAKYTGEGAFDGLIYVSVEDAPAGSTLKITIPVDNTDGNVAKLKAFLWDSFGNFKPVADAVTFPA